ncbi:rhomboid family protein [Planomonospora sphaerica]|uniref:Rhomboid family protein n=3 Tax=Planomonospora TaxID=1998 RepID=A0A171DP60_9ACTN|nr:MULTISPECIES: rhomboid family intramembrane serine protease [Planomonospora]GAT70844.1 rhomboid family protein [Planomonospora sphaerica]GGK98176.1 rhomboid family intramembrane serine protease [Planomonospora parontospora]GII12865.1 rhomboid family intramembrane serine protease [Planomonospora parontospora subsp. parontospora]
MEAKGRTAEIMIDEARKAFWVMVGFLALIWALHIPNALSGYRLAYEHGREARELSSLPDIASAPFLHWDWGHLQGNSGPLFVFGFLAAYRGVVKFLGVTGFIIVVSGFGSWLTSDVGSVSAGSSSVIFGYFGYVLVRGLFDRNTIDIVVGVVMAFCFADYFVGLLPQEGIGWQSHLFGFLGGLVGGWLFRERRRAKAPALPQDSRSALLKELDDLGLGQDGPAR